MLRMIFLLCAILLSFVDSLSSDKLVSLGLSLTTKPLSQQEIKLISRLQGLSKQRFLCLISIVKKPTDNMENWLSYFPQWAHEAISVVPAQSIVVGRKKNQLLNIQWDVIPLCNASIYIILRLFMRKSCFTQITKPLWYGSLLGQIYLQISMHMFSRIPQQVFKVMV